jgi:hypothetical protein
MSQTVCLDGVSLVLDVDRIDVDLTIPGLEEVSQEEGPPWVRCETGEAMEPVTCFEDGTAIYFHCPPEGTCDGRAYRVQSTHPHHWALELQEGEEEGHPIRIARLHPELE